MKLKRMTLVAAAAMVGPTLLSATPAMADDQPAVTVPDSAPKDDAAPVADPAPATKPAPETAPVVPVTPVTPVVEQPAVAAPPPVTPGPAPVAEQAGETKDAPADSELLGPDVRITGIPKDGFTPGGGWTPLTVTVDNSAHIEVKNLTPSSTSAGSAASSRLSTTSSSTSLRTIPGSPPGGSTLMSPPS